MNFVLRVSCFKEYDQNGNIIDENENGNGNDDYIITYDTEKEKFNLDGNFYSKLNMDNVMNDIDTRILENYDKNNPSHMYKYIRIDYVEDNNNYIVYFTNGSFKGSTLSCFRFSLDLMENLYAKNNYDISKIQYDYNKSISIISSLGTLYIQKIDNITFALYRDFYNHNTCSNDLCYTENKKLIGVISYRYLVFNYIFYSLYYSRYITFKIKDSVVIKDFLTENDNWSKAHEKLYSFAHRYIESMK